MERKRMRLPNGFGQISRIKGKRLRKPFRAMVNVGINEKTGHHKSKIIGYFETYNDAYTALLDYNRNPYDLNSANITVKELYEKWSEKYFKSLNTASSVRTITSAWNHSTELYDMNVKDLRVRHIKSCIEKEGLSENIASRIKSMFNLMLDYALEYDLVEKNYARDFTFEKGSKPEKEHIAFSKEEIDVLWSYKDDETAKLILVMCYMGWRPMELCSIKKCDVDLDRNIIRGGMKTKAGINRIVPIHPEIRNIIVEAYENGSEKLFISPDGSSYTYDKLRHKFNNLLISTNINKNHRLHDGRKTFISICNASLVNEYAIKMMAGHSIDDITEKIYTQRNKNFLSDELSKFNYRKLEI